MTSPETAFFAMFCHVYGFKDINDVDDVDDVDDLVAERKFED